MLQSSDNKTFDGSTPIVKSKCSSCGIDLQIAGQYDREANTLQGNTVILLNCHNCNNPIPLKRNNYDPTNR